MKKYIKSVMGIALLILGLVIMDDSLSKEAMTGITLSLFGILMIIDYTFE